MSVDYLTDWRAAQAAGHHPDCDGHRTAHRVYVVTDRGMSEAFCEDCGKLHAGSFGASANVGRMFADHSSDVACDGRCKDWQ